MLRFCAKCGAQKRANAVLAFGAIPARTAFRRCVIAAFSLLGPRRRGGVVFWISRRRTKCILRNGHAKSEEASDAVPEKLCLEQTG